MSNENNDLNALSKALEGLVASTAHGVVTVKAGAYRWASGVVLPNNLIAVANHSVRRGERVPVRTADGTKAEASVLGRDEGLDLAILKAEELDLRPLEHCEPESLRAGMLATVIGMTPDVGPSVSLGMMGAVGASRATWRGGKLDQFLRLDVNLYPSQAGAAVVSAEGKLIGMATPALSRHSTMAVPAKTLARIAEEAAKEGGIRHGYIGVGVQPVAVQSSVRSRLNLKHSAGLMLLSVEEGSAAEQAGLELGDILLEIDGLAISDPEELQALLRSGTVGKELRLTILRAGQIETTRTLTVGERSKKGK